MKKNQLNRKIGHQRVLIVGCGDIGLRILPLLRHSLFEQSDRLSGNRCRIFALTSNSDRCELLRSAGATPIVGNLDEPASLAKLANIATRIIYLAPPASVGARDTRSRHLVALLSQPCHTVYISTSGVYGDCGGEFIDETRRVNPRNPRAVRRVDAEQVWRHWARRTKSVLTILRVPGIYSKDRLPIDRLKNGVPALLSEQDVYTNHIHAQDLARLIVTALFNGSSNRLYNAVDDTCIKMGDYFDLVADHFHLPRPPRLPREQLEKQVSPMMLSFMSESRRMSNARIKQEWGFRFLYPQVTDGFKSG